MVSSLCRNIHGPQRMNPNDFGGHLAFPLVTAVGQRFHY